MLLIEVNKINFLFFLKWVLKDFSERKLNKTNKGKTSIEIVSTKLCICCNSLETNDNSILKDLTMLLNNCGKCCCNIQQKNLRFIILQKISSNKFLKNF